MQPRSMNILYLQSCSCLEACLLVDSACCGGGGVCYRCEARLACIALLILSTEIQDLTLDKGQRAGETKEEKVATGKNWKRMLTLRKLGCGEVEQPPEKCCIRSVLDPVGGLLCMLLLRWLLGRENLVLETENRIWCTLSLMLQNLCKEHNFCLGKFI